MSGSGSGAARSLLCMFTAWRKRVWTQRSAGRVSRAGQGDAPQHTGPSYKHIIRARTRVRSYPCPREESLH